MIDWFNYYKKKYLKSGKALAMILVKARSNPFCDEEIIIQLCDWLDADMEEKFGNKLPYRNAYNRFIEIVGDVNGIC